MKLLPEVPTQEIAVAVKKIEDAYGIPIPLTEVYSAIFTAAPDVKDEHCGWCHFVEYAEYITALEFCDSDAIGAFKVYRHPSRRIAALEAEVVKLREVATKAAEKRFCEAIIATQEISKTNGHLTCDVALLLAYYNDHKPKN